MLSLLLTTMSVPHSTLTVSRLLHVPYNLNAEVPRTFLSSQHFSAIGKTKRTEAFRRGLIWS